MYGTIMSAKSTYGSLSHGLGVCGINVCDGAQKELTEAGLIMEAMVIPTQDGTRQSNAPPAL
jgi:hypothetical protein